AFLRAANGAARYRFATGQVQPKVQAARSKPAPNQEIERERLRASWEQNTRLLVRFDRTADSSSSLQTGFLRDGKLANRAGSCWQSHAAEESLRHLRPAIWPSF